MDLHSVEILQVHLEDINDEYEHYINKVLEWAPEYTLEDILDDVEDGSATLVSVEIEDRVFGVALLRVEEHPQRIYLQVHMLGGDDMDVWIDKFRSKMREAAESLGLDGVIIHGRPGWQKVLKDLKPHRVTILDKIGE